MFEHDQLPQLIGKSLSRNTLVPRREEYPQGFFTTAPKPAAVLMPLIRKADGWHLLFIRRTVHEKDLHSGQVAFPGGHVDDSDANIQSTALREAQEEIGLEASHVDILGSIENYRTTTNFSVSAVIAHVHTNFRLRPDPREVDRAFSIPLAWLADSNNRETHPRMIEGFEHEIDVLYFRHYDGELLWGITARLVECFITLLDDIRLTGSQ